MNKWYEKTWLVGLLCAVFFPVGLYGLWKSQTLKMGAKVTVSVLFAVLLVVAVSVPKQSVASDNAIVMNGFDGSVYQVVDFIKGTLKDPDSFKAYKWGKVGAVADTGFTVWVDFGAKNSLGAMERQTWAFDLDKNGHVVDVIDGNLKKIYP